MAGVKLKPGVYVKESFYEIEKFEYPCQELESIMQKYLFCSYDENIKMNINGELGLFKEKLLFKFRVPESEKHNFGLNVTFGNAITVSPLNLFSACLLYGEYVPYIISGYYDEVILQKGGKVTFDKETGHASLILSFQPKYSTEELNEMTHAERERYGNAYTQMRFAVNIMENSKSVKEVQKNIRDFFLPENIILLSDDELRSYISTKSPDEYKIIAKEIDRRKKYIQTQFELENGVPYGSIRLEPNKKYSGRADGDFRIETVNGIMWIIPETSCFDFDEIK